MKRILVVITAGLLMFVGSSLFAAITKVGVVDYQKIAQKISFQPFLKKKIQESSEAQNKNYTELTSQISSIDKKLNDTQTSSEKKKVLQAELDTQKQKLQTMQTEMQMKAMKVRQSLSEEMKVDLEKTIGSIAAKHHVEQVFTSMGLAYAADKVDLTDEIITELAKTYGLNTEPAPQGNI